MLNVLALLDCRVKLVVRHSYCDPDVFLISGKLGRSVSSKYLTCGYDPFSHSKMLIFVVRLLSIVSKKEKIAQTQVFDYLHEKKNQTK